MRVLSMRAKGLALAAAFLVSGGLLVTTRAAELPTQRSAPQQHVEKCKIDGEEGVKVPGSDFCLKISGYVSGGVELGNVKRP